MDEQAAVTGDWVLPSPSPKAFVPSFLGEDAEFSFGPMMRQMPGEDIEAKQGDFSFDNDMILRPLSEHYKTSPRGGLATRIAARAGFNAPRLNTESIRSKSDRPSTDESKSVYLTIPSGISPTALLESPVFVSNSLSQASPTTGKFQLFTDGNGKSYSVDSSGVSKDSNFDKTNKSSSFAFKPHGEPALPFSLSTAYKARQNMNSQALSDADLSVRTENTSGNFEPSQVQSHESLSILLTDKESGDKVGRIRSLDTISHTAEHSPSLSCQQDDVGDHHQTIGVDSIAAGMTGFVAEDGCHWRKYGQKQVKGSEYPRSYYRCTYMNCPVKKKVERSPKGRITEITYKGSHSHPVPAPNDVSTMCSSQFDNNHGQVENGGTDRDPVWGAPHNGLLLGPRDWRNGYLEQDSISLINPEIPHPLSSAPMQNGILESGDAVARSSTYSNDEGKNDCGTHGSISNDEGDESESKRRRTESFAAELGSGATRAIREPRVVVQTRSDVDILDDGYRWRKYGQKVVKGNPNPRSYYKCTYVDCNVRKHVERASNDHRSVITTYEGKHNHDVPAARNSSHGNSPISAALASLPQNLILAQHPHPSSFNRPMIQPPVPPQHPHGFQMGMNQPSLPGNRPDQSNFIGMPTSHSHPMQQQPKQMSGMGFMMPRGDPNSAPNLYRSNGSSGYHQVMNRLPSGP